MPIFSRVPLARLNLTHDKLRLAARVSGMAFAVFLLFIELGFRDALLEGSVQLIRQFNGSLIVVSQANYTLAVKEPFSYHILIQAYAVREVKRAFPVYLEHPKALWKDTSATEGQASASQPIRVIAFNPDQAVLKNAELTASDLDALKVPFNVLLDRESKEKTYGQIAANIDRELAGHNVHVAGLFALGTDFANDGNVITSAETFARLFGEDSPRGSALDWIDVGVLQIAPGADDRAVSRMLQNVLPEDVRVYTKDEFLKREKDYWNNTTPMGFIFFLGLCVGFLVGTVICCQIISTDVAEYLPQFATLKAMGYSDAFLNGVVLREALWLGGLGFVLGWGLSKLAYWWLSREIHQLMNLDMEKTLLVAFFTVVMCVASGLIALRRVRTADPAEVFA